MIYDELNEVYGFDNAEAFAPIVSQSGQKFSAEKNTSGITLTEVDSFFNEEGVDIADIAAPACELENSGWNYDTTSSEGGGDSTGGDKGNSENP